MVWKTKVAPFWGTGNGSAKLYINFRVVNNFTEITTPPQKKMEPHNDASQKSSLLVPGAHVQVPR